MKRWKVIAAVIMTLGLSTGLAVSAYAQEKELSNGNKAEGVWISDKQEGPGRIYYTDGRVFEGFYVHGSLEGAGIIYKTDGTRNIYTYFDNQANGLALQISKDGEAAASFYEDHKLKKDVTLQNWELIDGTHYYAKEKTDIDDGKAIAVYMDGSIYVGDFKNKKRNGWGTCFYPGGTQYVGTWKDDTKDGVGYQVFAQDAAGLFSSGFWSNGKRQNSCQYDKNDNILLTVNKDGRAEGPAVYIKADKTITFCEYKDGKVSNNNSEADVFTDENGNRFLGVKDGKNGTGLKVSKEGTVYIGDFKDGLAEGNTFIRWPNSQTLFQGTCKAGKRTEGVILWPSGTYYSGTYRDDKDFTYDKGSIRRPSHSYSEGTYTTENKLSTGTYTTFNKDGSSVTKKYKDGKEEK